MTRRRSRLPDLLIGVGCLAGIAAIVLVTLASYNKVFVPSDTVILQAGKTGNALQKGSDVKFNGVPVGSVRKIEPVPGGARLTLGIDPSQIDRIPSNVQARLLPKTMFGERYVALVKPVNAASASTHLDAGETIHEDTSKPAVELQQLFDNMLPLLRSIKPAKLASMMGSMAEALHDNGNDIGKAFTDWAHYLGKLNPHVATMADDLGRLADVARTYQDAAPDIISALDDFVTTGKTLVERNHQLEQLYANVISSADTTHGWVAGNEDTIEVLSDRSRKALTAIAPYASEFPCIFAAARKFIPRMDKILGKGTDEPGIHVQLSIVAARKKYLPGRDSPVFEHGKAPRCPYVTGETGTRPARVSTSSTTDDRTTTADGSDVEPVETQPRQIAPPPNEQLRRRILSEGAGLGPANSPAENQMLGELLAPDANMSPEDYPQWASLMVGPLFRGKAVVIR